MTEEQWLSSVHPQSLLALLKDHEQRFARKLRLFACACCRRIWHHLPDERSRAAVEAAERFADGLIGADELAAAYRPARQLSIDCARADRTDPRQYTLWAPADACHRSADSAAFSAALDASWTGTRNGEPMCTSDVEERAQAALLRDIIGSPFRPVGFDPRWRTGSAVELAEWMYWSQDLAAMPALADALQMAGCADPDILAHCRGPGPHVRGCWVVDMVLGKG